MVNFKEIQNQEATVYRRCNRILIEHPLNHTSAAKFSEERVVEINENKYTIPLYDSNKIELVFEPGKEMPILDPVTLEPTGETFTHADLYQLIMSSYIFAVEEKEASIGSLPTP